MKNKFCLRRFEMLKGINKQVLEIIETQNGFFEKAIFFVKPEYSGLSEGRLRESAKKEFENAGRPPISKYTRRDKIKTVVCLGVTLSVGFVIGFIFSSAF